MDIFLVRSIVIVLFLSVYWNQGAGQYIPKFLSNKYGSSMHSSHQSSGSSSIGSGFGIKTGGGGVGFGGHFAMGMGSGSSYGTKTGYGGGYHSGSSSSSSFGYGGHSQGIKTGYAHPGGMSPPFGGYENGPQYGYGPQPGYGSSGTHIAGGHAESSNVKISSSYSKTSYGGKPNTGSLSPTKDGLFRGGCKSMPKAPMNAKMKCSSISGCQAFCIPKYQFPNGKTELIILCQDGEWQVEKSEWETIPSCEPICSPPCLNQGICISPDQCKCPENFSGTQCEFETKPCLNYPPMPVNAKRSCSSTLCTITCLKGHTFPDASSIANMVCKDGSWVPSKEEWASIPNCEATCNPACLNGGKCLSFNVCQCAKEFRGSQCQYGVEACSAKKLKFNGSYKCSGTGDSLNCKLSCPEDIHFEFPPAAVYTCLYAEGTFTPSPVPKCLYGSDVNVISMGAESHSFYEEGTNSTYIVDSSFTNDTSISIDGYEEITTIYKKPKPGEHLHNDSNVIITHPGTLGSTETEGVVTERKHLGSCFTWTGSHFKTFDGKVFSFTCSCAYTLVQDAIDNTFSIVIQNSETCSKGPENCYKVIKIYQQEKQFILKRSEDGKTPIFATDKKILPIPGRVPGIRVDISAHYLIVFLDSVGAKIKWDGWQFIQVEVQASLWNRTVGLCGKLDGDPNNDMLLKDETKPTNAVAFASSWQVDTLDDACTDVPNDKHTCRDTKVKGKKDKSALKFCKEFLSNKKFKPCHKVIDFDVLLDACQWDYCNCKKSDPKECACETLNVYVRECTNKGVKGLSEWRDEETCPIHCTGGMIYMSCGPSEGQGVCGGVFEKTDEIVSCEEGCYCPNGTVLHDSKCIKKENCPCMYRGKEFSPGATVSKDCNTCTCSDGKWECSQETCGARCSILGDPHYITFDGKRYDFMGQCTYHVLKHNNFTIDAENVACAGTISEAMNFPVSLGAGLPSCTKTVIITINGHTIKLKQNHEVVINGKEVSKIPYNLHGINIRAVSSIFLIVELPNGAEVWWDGLTRAYIDIPASFMRQTKGLCGTFNLNQKDDFLTPEGDIEESVPAFANKWKTSETCKDIPEKVTSHPCDVNIYNKKAAEKHCKIIKSDLFADCHWDVDPESFYQDCMYDMCSCDGKIGNCLCPMIAAYAEECARKGVKIDWRNKVRECGMHCPGGQKYQVCGNSCTRTCYDIATQSYCSQQCVEGCNCPEGEALNEKGQCVPIAECGCQYNGLDFPVGYKEIRSTSSASELCTCSGAQWNCRSATPGEMIEYPSVENFKNQCNEAENKEFTLCEPTEPVTCKNMHSLELFSSAICHAGCKCKEGYVLNTYNNTCIKPTECPCHHGGQSYNENAVIQSDCNICTCSQGKWQCTEKECLGECSAWGDSHYKTFDGKLYDYQGQCDYVLVKGEKDKHSFDISIQNVPCGSFDVSCSKSITIKANSGISQESITLTKDEDIPEHNSLQKLYLRQKGHFVIIEAPEMGINVLWDKGTRVYVRLSNTWKNKVKGLCGNYNDNQLDDFQTPSGGVAEVSSQLFGDSWRLQPYCTDAPAMTDTCEQRPARKQWALKQCGMLKSSPFSKCHSAVPVEPYLEKCVFDSCACDQGGDCDCLCTALAAYAQECNNKGIPIKWRTPDLCPMQCDEHCAKYSACISTCPIETCDNMLVASQLLSKMCDKEACIEGCHVKDCPPGFIYLNSSYLECTPRNVCKPLCLEINGVLFYEGDLIEEDACHSCYCSRGKKNCQGQPCITVPQHVAPTISQPIACTPGWTEWINNDKASPTEIETGKISDVESLPSPFLMKGSHCQMKNIVDIECRTVKTHIAPKETGLNIECSLERGLLCQTKKGGQLCPDFEIRVKCECNENDKPYLTTKKPIYKTCDPSIPIQEHPYDCHLFYQCAPGEHGLELIEQTCGPDMMYHPNKLVCDFPAEVVAIKPQCKEARDDVYPHQPLHPEVPVERPHVPEINIPIETYPIEPGTPNHPGDTYPVKLPQPSVCAPGEEFRQCAIQCQNTCGYFLHMLKIYGVCQNDQLCVEACVPHQKLQQCPPGMFWANSDTCVAIHDCLCVSRTGKPVKPGVSVWESNCEVCQCIDNYYTCDKSLCTGQIPKPTKPTSEMHAVSDIPEIVDGSYIVPSTVTPPPSCDENNFVHLIDGDVPLSDEAFSASSTYGKGFAPKYARFSSTKVLESAGSWAPQVLDQNQYLQINLGHEELIYGIIVKGSPIYNEYVTSYTILYTSDGYTFSYVTDSKNQPKVFRGCVNSNNPVRQMFEIPIEAQIIKINPRTWHNKISLQVELIGCNKFSSTSGSPATTPQPMWVDPMGVSDGMMSDQQITVSSELEPDHTKEQLKLNGILAWQPITNSPFEWVQFNFLEPRNITGIVTKGGPDGWVTSFKIVYSHDGKHWNPILDVDGTEYIFLANFDENTPQIVGFKHPIQTTILKLIPVKWYENIQFRVEIYGQFVPYPSKEVASTQITPEECNCCPGVPLSDDESDACKCKDDKWWNGKDCVPRTQCPCMVGHIQYAIGTVFVNEECDQCVCKLGGVSHCTPKVCEKCAQGLQSIVTSTCTCTCHPCPEGTTLCPTSNVCINSTSWCNGVKDCPDDEKGCSSNMQPPFDVEIFQPPIVNDGDVPSKIVNDTHKECPVVACPRGFQVKLKNPTQTEEIKQTYKTMFSNSKFLSKKGKYTKGGIKGGNSKTEGVKTGGIKGSPIKQPQIKEPEEECKEFECISTSTEYACPPVTCPPGYTVVTDQPGIKKSTKDCSYECKPPPPVDAVCNVIGRIFNTFDLTEFKYDICNHIIARDLEYNQWEISFIKNCTNICSRNLKIKHEDHVFILYPDLSIEYDGYKYNVEQTKRIGTQSHSFMITQLGEMLVFASHEFGFWVIWDTQGNAKIGVTRKLLHKVDGLCGYFNDNPKDDKRKPDKTIAKTTTEFGDSWVQADQGYICKSKYCPAHIQNKVWKICNLAKEHTFVKCAHEVNLDAFISRCMETTCTCLEKAGSKEEQEECRCSALQSLVVDCLSSNSDLEVFDWRMKYDCPAHCEAPLVHHDCYRRSCEPSCGALTDPNACPKLNNICFPGCYCPPGYVRKGENCVLPTSCGDCECNVLPHLKYVTYDEKNFTIDGNCIYVMSRDILEKGSKKHNFQVLITNHPCQKKKDKMCVGKVTILYDNHKVHIVQDTQRPNLKLIADSEAIYDFKEIEEWAKVIQTPAKHLKIMLHKIQVQVTVYYPSLGVSVKLPSLKYSGKLEGLCGDCNGNLNNDFEMPNGLMAEDENEFGVSWLYEELVGGQNKEQCANKPKEVCEDVQIKSDPCIQLEDVSKYGQCHPLLNPDMFIEWCKKDTCNGHPELSCTAIEAYSRECAYLGFCVDWRTTLCPAKECPRNQEYLPCAPSCSQTCEAVVKNELKCNNPPVEGCFCPPGKLLLNNTCVTKERCEACDDEGHRSGDVWHKDECTKCTCMGENVKCEKQTCPSVETICEEGFTAMKVPAVNECCSKYICVPMPTSSTTCEPPQQIHCSKGQIMKLIKKSDGCQQFVCECKPIEECESINKTTAAPLEPGIVNVVDDSGCCPVVKEICKKELCPKAQNCPQFHDVEKTATPDKCCPVYTCVPPKDKCIVSLQYTTGEKGGERPRNEYEKQKVLKEPNEKWQDGPCRECKCISTSTGNYHDVCTVSECPVLTESIDHQDYVLEEEPVLGQCCSVIKKVACKHHGNTYKVGEKWQAEGDYCTTVECSETTQGIQKLTQVKTCNTDCELGWEYVPATSESKQCCGSCKPVACVVDGEVHKVGEQWTSADYCTNYFCSELNGTVQLQSVVVNCPELSSDIIKDYVVETTPVFGECCETHRIVGCKDGDNKYKVGDTWPSSDGDKCKTIKCNQNMLGEIVKQQSSETCNTNCLKGWEYKKAPDACCGECVQMGCIVGDELKKPGEKWNSTDGCSTYYCDLLGDQFTTITQRESCPDIGDCPLENVYTKGCCKHCNLTSASLVACGPKQFETIKTIGLLSTIKPPHGKCINKEGVKGFTECDGHCHSYTIFNQYSGQRDSVCTCCQPSMYAPILVQFECNDGYRFKKQIGVPTKCDCKACTSQAPSKGGIKTSGTKGGIKTG